MIKKMFNSKIICSITIIISLVSCSKNNEIVSNSDNTSNSSLINYLKTNADYIHEINGFYIVGSAINPTSEETTAGTTGKDVFDHSVRLFSSFLDQNNDGVVDEDMKVLNLQMAKTVMFISGPLNLVDKISESPQVNSQGLYGLSMQTDNWPYVKNYNGKGWVIDKLTSFTWRPENMNALWEEVFHTITEAISRSDNEFAFTQGKKLRQFMEDDITARTYDISEQNAEENGNYDKITAVNEYIHQIWAINFAGQENKLNTHQQKALAFMKNKQVPMSVNADYSKTIGIKIK
ncbi:hypothetical protein ACSIGC_10495 [Tenacibaculum sp. ZS6-P6]|uniref:hypothetical protein n=1 Tax=Tenacibaculum sp. ZS6-P6 TaxID=3447503 RepID=UPI003F954C86